ncbi:hypothetical protein A7X60_01510 [Stenotrophomonas maltophilia]|nr:hypothetical protein A7X60_01510 [Stenotrophomonas maltophilia]
MDLQRTNFVLEFIDICAKLAVLLFNRIKPVLQFFDLVAHGCARSYSIVQGAVRLGGRFMSARRDVHRFAFMLACTSHKRNANK